MIPDRPLPDTVPKVFSGRQLAVRIGREPLWCTRNPTRTGWFTIQSPMSLAYRSLVLVSRQKLPIQPKPRICTELPVLRRGGGISSHMGLSDLDLILRHGRALDPSKLLFMVDGLNLVGKYVRVRPGRN